MAGPKGYSSYRGRGPLGKALLIIVLALIILASIGFLLLQKYIVYDDSGTPHLLLPETTPTEEVGPPSEQEEPSIDLTIEGGETPGGTVVAPVAAQALSADPARWASEVDALAAAGQSGFSLTVKASGGSVQYASALPGASLSATAAAASAALPGLLASKAHSIARLSCFRDGLYAAANLESAGLKNTGGYIFYDGANTTWLDPAKPAARQYLIDLAKECAALGFDEILLTDVSYPTVGKLDKIAYGEQMKDANIQAFLTELRAALAEYPVRISIELPAAVLTDGRDSVAGLLFSDIVPLVDLVYAVTTPEQVEVLTAAVAAARPEIQFVPELTQPQKQGNYLLLEG